MVTTGFHVKVADLLHRPASRREIVLEVPSGALGTPTAQLVDSPPARLRAVLERVPDGIVVRGRVEGRYTAPCSRCLEPTEREFACAVQELFEPCPLEGETYPLHHDEVDLELPLRDAVLLELPTAPLCDESCRGLCPVCGVNRNESACDCDPNPPDPRWDALRELKL
jgi:uncharacterized protein